MVRMAVIVDPVEVLNGTITIGDEVAYAIRYGNVAGIRVGIVTGFTIRKSPGGSEETRVKIHVTRTSERWDADYETTTGMLNRIVKLA